MGFSTGGGLVAAALCLAVYLIYKKMARAGSPFFKIGWVLLPVLAVAVVHIRHMPLAQPQPQAQAQAQDHTIKPTLSLAHKPKAGKHWNLQKR